VAPERVLTILVLLSKTSHAARVLANGHTREHRTPWIRADASRPSVKSAQNDYDAVLLDVMRHAKTGSCVPDNPRIGLSLPILMSRTRRR